MVKHISQVRGGHIGAQTGTDWHTKNRRKHRKICATDILSVKNNNTHSPVTKPGTRRRDVATHSQPTSYTIDISYTQSQFSGIKAAVERSVSLSPTYGWWPLQHLSTVWYRSYEKETRQQEKYLLYFTSLHFTSLYFILVHFTSIYFTSLHFTYLLTYSMDQSHS